MNCPNCGTEIAAGGTFCGRCGTRMPLPKRDIEIEAGSNVRDSLGQGWSNDGKVVEFQHFSGMR